MRQWTKPISGALLIVLSTACLTRADTVTFVGSDAGRSASVTFTHTGTQLSILLQNTSPGDVMVPDDVLAGIFFGMEAGSLNPTLTKTGGTAQVGPGSSVYLFGSGGSVEQKPLITDIGGEWAFKNFASSDYEYGIGASGFNSPFEFGVGDLFGGTNYSGPASPNGMQFGLLSAGDNLATRNDGLEHSAGKYFIKSSALFTLQVTSGFNIHDIDQVRFQYGTSLSQPSYPGEIIPLPSAAWAGMSLFGVLGIMKARRLRMTAAV